LWAGDFFGAYFGIEGTRLEAHGVGRAGLAPFGPAVGGWPRWPFLSCKLIGEEGVGIFWGCWGCQLSGVWWVGRKWFGRFWLGCFLVRAFFLGRGRPSPCVPVYARFAFNSRGLTRPGCGAPKGGPEGDSPHFRRPTPTICRWCPIGARKIGTVPGRSGRYRITSGIMRTLSGSPWPSRLEFVSRSGLSSAWTMGTTWSTRCVCGSAILRRLSRCLLSWPLGSSRSRAADSQYVAASV